MAGWIHSSFIKPNPRLLIKKSRRLIDAAYPGPLKSYYFTGPPIQLN